MDKSNYRYTIIIPHYRIPKLLKRCLWSIPKRNDLQVLVVDDYSDADSIVQLRKLEREFTNVTFIYSKMNGGGGRARNIGLTYAKGDYVLFADADDFFNYCVDDILDEYTNSNYDIIFFNACQIDTDTYLPTRRRTTLQSALKLFYKTNDFAALKYMFGEPWCKLIKRKLIVNNDMTFDEIPIHNDTKFSYMIGFYAENVLFDNRALYTLADRAASVSKDLSDTKKMIRVKVFSEKNRFLADNNITYFDNLMLTPFKSYLKQRDWEHLRLCFEIAANYGFPKFLILGKIVKSKLLSFIYRRKC